MTVDLIAVLVVAAVTFVIGFLTHGPLLGKVWMRLAGISMPENPPSLMTMLPQMGLNYIANVVFTFTIAVGLRFYFISPYAPERTWLWGALVAGVAYLGLVAPLTSYGVIWMGQSKKLWLFETATQLLNFMVAGALLIWWRW
jgi:hypothetical protein